MRRAAIGRHDGWILLVMYLAGSGLWTIADHLADARALRGLDALQSLAPLVYLLLPWVLTGLAVEVALGRAEERPGLVHLLRVPLVACALLGAALGNLGLAIPGPSYAIDLVGAAWSAGLAVGLRSGLGEGAETSEPPPPLRRLAAIAGGLFALLFTVNVATAVHQIHRDWGTMAPVASGEPLPELRAPLHGGGELRGDELRGAVSVLVFWTTWCGVCEQEMPTLVALHERFAAHGVAVIGVNSDRKDQRERVARYLARRDLPFPVALDSGEFGDALRVSVYPHIVLADARGVIRYVHQGRVSEGTLAAEVRTLLGER
ncbi:MAG: TlpA disulfide reductase family protein [Nannocystaceae bacterium]|nr:TlpA family protein disulfide reductase [Myxococcales bacterium]